MAANERESGFIPQDILLVERGVPTRSECPERVETPRST
jgi:hypothetical protein